MATAICDTCDQEVIMATKRWLRPHLTDPSDPYSKPLCEQARSGSPNGYPDVPEGITRHWTPPQVGKPEATESTNSVRTVSGGLPFRNRRKH